MPALGIASNQARLVTHTDLAHVHANVEVRGEILDELTEINAILGGEVEHGFLATEEVLDPHGLHLETVLLYQTPEFVHGILALDGEVVGKLKVGIGGDAQYRFERSRELRDGNLEGIGGDQTDLGTTLGGADGIIGLDDVEPLGVEPQVARGVGELNRND